MKRLPRLAGAPAALDLMLTGKTIDARRAKRLGIADECVPARIMENAARGILKARPRAAAARLSAVADAESAGAARHRRAGAKAGREARAAASTIRRPTRSSTSGPDTTAMRSPCRPSRSGVDPVAPEDADRRQPDPRLRLAGAVEVPRQGRELQGGARARRRRRNDGRRHRGVVRAARPDGHAAGSERRPARAGDGRARRSSSPNACAMRAACAMRRIG